MAAFIVLHLALLRDSAADELRLVVRSMVIGVVPFSLAIGAAIGATGLSTAQGRVSGPAILAGAAQLTTVEMLDGGAAPVVIVLSALMINARILLYSASMAPCVSSGHSEKPMLAEVSISWTAIPRSHGNPPPP